MKALILLAGAALVISGCDGDNDKPRPPAEPPAPIAVGDTVALMCEGYGAPARTPVVVLELKSATAIVSFSDHDNRLTVPLRCLYSAN